MNRDCPQELLQETSPSESFVVHLIERTKKKIEEVESIGTRPVELTHEMYKILALAHNNAKLVKLSNKEILLAHYYEKEAIYMRLFLQIRLQDV